MPIITDSYNYIQQKVRAIKTQYQFLRTKPDDYAFSAVCIKNSIYKNPALHLEEDFLRSAIVDGSYDGGADFILLDPNNSEASDLIIGQAKYCTVISTEIAKNAINKMVDFYLNMKGANYRNIREEVIRRFTTLNAEVGDESKIKFVLFTSASKNSIRLSTLEKVIKERLDGEEKYELQVFFGSDVEDEIKAAESRRPCVEEGKLIIDLANNVLEYGDNEAVVVNISAMSLKRIYAQHGTNLLAKNLRYFIKGKSDVNTEVRNTIKNCPETFWYKNNGITIVCEEFKVDSKELKLKNFSIVNGGQTTTLIFKSDLDEQMDDFFVVCKVISAKGNTEDERSEFVLSVAKATNSQKPIKLSDLKANAPEQIRFASTMNEVGIYYKTKRGEEIPAAYREDYKNTDVAGVGKLSLAGIFQLPAMSRNKPSASYNDRFYNPTFNTNQVKVSKYIRDLLYVDNYFRKGFLTKYDQAHRGMNVITFAHNARTICISFVALASRILQANLDSFERVIDHAGGDDFYENKLYPVLKNFENLNYILKPSIFEENRDILDGHLYLHSALANG